MFLAVLERASVVQSLEYDLCIIYIFTYLSRVVGKL